MNNFSVGEPKVGEKQSRQSNSKYNFMQYVFYEKGIRSIPGVCGKALKAGEFSRIFVLKVILQKSQSTFNCQLQKQES